MKIEVEFTEKDCSFTPDFGEVQTAGDGGYAEGYEAGHRDGSDAGYKNGYEDGTKNAVTSLPKAEEVAF